MSEKHKEIINKVNDGFNKNDPEVFLSFCTDDVKWSMAGQDARTGKESIREWMSSMEGMGPPKIDTKGIISDGDSAACYGEMTMPEKGETNFYSFCDIYQFKNDKITELESFAVKHTPEGEKEKTASA